MQYNKEVHELHPLPDIPLNNTQPNDLNDVDGYGSGPRNIKGSVFASPNAGLPVYSSNRSRPPMSPVISVPPRNDDKWTSHFAGRRHFSFANVPEFHFNSKRIVTISLILYLVEYLLIFGWQLAAYLCLHDTFHRAHWVVGLIFLIFYVLLSLVLIFLVGKRCWKIAFVVKFFEFAFHFMLLGWAVAYLEFAFLSFSYMMIFDILLVLFWVCSLDTGVQLHKCRHDDHRFAGTGHQRHWHHSGHQLCLRLGSHLSWTCLLLFGGQL